MPLKVLSVVFVFTLLCCTGVLAKDISFVGSKQCADCHEEEFANFMKMSKKAHSWNSIEIMKSNLKPDELETCYECHTTGHGKPGGFVSFESTPDLAYVGCETCHGPGSAHIEDGDPDTITRRPSMETCIVCHNEQRVGDFGFKPLRFSGAH